MAVAEPQHARGRPKKKTRIVPPSKGQRGPPSVEQDVDEEMSMMVSKPQATPVNHPCSQHGKDEMRPISAMTKDVDAGLSPLERLRKAAKRGEGSHGGHVVGHTRSGKPIYDAGSRHYDSTRRILQVMATPVGRTHTRAGKATLDAHPGWSSRDHRDAAALHGKHAAARDPESGAASHFVSFAHTMAANSLKSSEEY